MDHVQVSLDGALREPFPVDALPEPVAAFVTELSTALGCAAEVVATPTLAVLAGAIGAGATLTLKSGYVEPGVLWGVVIAREGTMLAVEQVIARLIEPLAGYEAEERADLARERESYDRRMARIRERRSQGDYLPPEAEPFRPREHSRRVLVHELDIARVTQTIAANRSGVIAARADLDGWWSGLARSARRGDAVWSTWRQLYHRGTIEPIVRVRAQAATADAEPVADAVCSVAGAIAYETFRASATARHRDRQGIGEPHWPELFRVALLAMPDPSVPTWTDASVTDATRERFNRLIEALLFDNQLVDANDEPFDLELPDACRAAWAQAYTQLAPSGPTAISLAARLTLVLHRILAALGESESLEVTDAMEADAAANAARLAGWYERERRRIFTAIGASMGDDQVARVERFLRCHSNAATVRDLMRSGPRFATAEAARDVLDRIAADGRGAWEADRFVLHESVMPATA